MLGADNGLDNPNAALTKWLVSVGGRAALASIHSMEISDTVENSVGSAQTAERTLLLEPNMIRVEMAIPGGRTLVISTDGKVGWQEVSNLGFGLMAPSAITGLFLSRDPAFIARQIDNYSNCESLPTVSRDGARCDAFLVHLKTAENERWYFDSLTGFLVSAEGGTDANPVVVKFSDYRKIGPVFLPFEFQYIVGGKTAVAIHRSSITLNVTLSGSYFSAMKWDIDDAAKAQGILDKYIRACANPEANAKLRSRIIRETVDIPASGISSTSLIEFKYPNRILLDSETKGIGREVTGFDGTTGWANSEIQGYHVLKKPEIAALYRIIGILGDPKIEQEAQLRRVIGARIIGGRNATALSLSSLNESIGTFYFDDENGHLLQYSSTQKTSSGTKPVATLELSDFRRIDGEDIPFEAIETNTVLQVVTKIQSVENNATIDDEIFKPRIED